MCESEIWAVVKNSIQAFISSAIVQFLVQLKCKIQVAIASLYESRVSTDETFVNLQNALK